MAADRNRLSTMPVSQVLSPSMNAETNPETSTVSVWKSSPEAEMLVFICSSPALFQSCSSSVYDFKAVHSFALSMPNNCSCLILMAEALCEYFALSAQQILPRFLLSANAENESCCKPAFVPAFPVWPVLPAGSLISLNLWSPQSHVLVGVMTLHFKAGVL